MISDKIKGMINSMDHELQLLGYSLLQEEQPAIWACLVCYTGIGLVTDELADMISEHMSDIFNVGHMVRYRGMPNCPNMVVTEIRVMSIPRASAGVAPKYYSEITAKYFNKSTQCFVTIKDRIECFEIIKTKTESNES